MPCARQHPADRAVDRRRLAYLLPSVAASIPRYASRLKLLDSATTWRRYLRTQLHVRHLRRSGEPAMTTAIIGTGNIGGQVARHLVAGGERVLLAARDESHAAALANELGPLARAVSV